MEDDALPPQEEYTKLGNVIGLDIKYVTKEVVDNLHDAGKKCVVFFSYLDEVEKYYKFLIYLGVDVLISDRAVEMHIFK
jgi:glycerophosphoryl diester phosphodiesterase